MYIHLPAWLGLEGSTYRQAHSHGWPVGASMGGGPQFISVSSSECPQCSDQLPPEQVIQGAMVRKCWVPFMTSLPKLHVVNTYTFRLPHGPDSVRGVCTRAWISKSEAHWGLAVAFTPHSFSNIVLSWSAWPSCILRSGSQVEWMKTLWDLCPIMALQKF